MKEEIKNWCVYCHTNKINGKKYIGITCQNPPEKRWKNGIGYKGSVLFYNAIKKYTWNGFKHEILMIELTEKESKQKEIEFIKKYRTNDRNFGYNLTFGGEGISGFKMSNYSKEKMSASKKISSTKYWLGKERDVKTKELISEALRNRTKELREQIGDKLSTPVLQFDKNGKFIKEWKSVSEVCRNESFTTRGNITSCCNKKIKSAYGYIWIYKENYNDTIEVDYKPNYYKRKIVQLSLDCVFINVWDSAIEAERNKGFNNGHIIQCCKGKVKTHKGYKWMYYDDYINLHNNLLTNDKM